MKKQLNNQKSRLFKGKITKSYSTFCENKPNFVNPEIGVISFETDKYEILPAGSSEKTNPIKPNLSQYKPNSNPIAEKAIINLSSLLTSKYEKVGRWQDKKTNPNLPLKLACLLWNLPGVYPRVLLTRLAAGEF